MNTRPSCVAQKRMTQLPPKWKKQGPGFLDLQGYCLAGGARSETSAEWSCEESDGANSVRNGCGSLPTGAMPAGTGLATFETLELTVSPGEQKPQLPILMPCMPASVSIGMFMPLQCS